MDYIGITARKIQKRLGTIIRRRSFEKFDLNKKDVIDFVFRNVQHEPRSFADLGGVWGVHGAYTFYTLDNYEIESSFLVDTDFTEKVINQSRKHSNLILINSNFGNSTVLGQIGKVDAIFLFDVLLHQVKPDWDEILELFTPVTNCFVVFNPQFINAEQTVRLLDLGVDDYFKNVPFKRDNPLYKDLFEKMYDIHPQYNRIWRDIHNVWQWGITDRDLRGKMEELGFKLSYFMNCGRFGYLENFENHAFVFSKE